MSTSLTVRIPDEVAAEISAEAELRRVPLSQVVRDRLMGVAPVVAPKVVVASPSKALHYEVKDGPTECEHDPKRRRQVVGGKICLDCRTLIPGV